jgi:lipopolysaccharide biosynthesis glycosyltransferase
LTPIPIILALDRAYLLPTAVTIFSILKNHPITQFRIYIIIGESNSDWLQPLEEMASKMGSELIVKLVNVEILSGLKLGMHFTVPTYFRLLAPNLIEESKVIYLDTDVLIHGDLTELWETDMGDYPVAAVADPLRDDFHRLGLTKETGYFNAGVMIFQLDLWRKLNLGNASLDYVMAFSEKISFADQDGLNATLKGNWLRLHPKWNVQSSLLEKSACDKAMVYFSEEELAEALDKPRIIHFTGNPKPWNIGCKNAFKPLYWDYLRQTPFSRTLPLDFTIRKAFVSLVPLTIRKKYWRYTAKKKAKS